MTTDQIKNLTFKELMNYIEGSNRRITLYYAHFETLFMMYCATPQYATHSRKKFNPKKLLETKIYRLKKRRKSLYECRDILRSIDLYREMSKRDREKKG